MADFLAAAGHIDRGIQMTYARVAEIRKLASQRSVFNDREDKIADLRQLLKRDFEALGKDIESLEQRTTNDPQIGAHTHTRSHAKAVVNGLKTKVTQATKQFAQILQKQTKMLQEESNRRRRFESSKTVGQLRMRRRAVDGFWKKNDQATHSEKLRLQQLQQQESDMKYLDRRASAIQNIESTLNELGSVYNKMATIVASQQEIAIRIDENMSSTLEQTELGHNELMKYFSAISGNRSFILKIFGILIAVALLFTYLRSSS
uniref:t-SNARE coiled-coil homology domain-containing protein n=1 Tax=Lotharella globosa TaxID=91324 RepID=A0A7S3ZBX2_9EUKA